MKYSHSSPELNQLLNQKVTIMFYDEKKSSGILKQYPTEYRLETQEGTICFKKSHVKKIWKY